MGLTITEEHVGDRVRYRRSDGKVSPDAYPSREGEVFDTNDRTDDDRSQEGADEGDLDWGEAFDPNLDEDKRATPNEREHKECRSSPAIHWATRTVLSTYFLGPKCVVILVSRIAQDSIV